MIPGNIFSISHKACDLIGQLVAGKNFSDYQNDPLLRFGVERQFGIIGETLNPFRPPFFRSPEEKYPQIARVFG
jgi:uncharacterized protein with HEPN domain